MKRYKHNPTSNTLEQIPEMEEPKFDYEFPPDGPSDSLLQSAINDHEENFKVYEQHIASLETLNCAPGTSWPDVVNEGEFYIAEEGDFDDEGNAIEGTVKVAVPFYTKEQSDKITAEQERLQTEAWTGSGYPVTKPTSEGNEAIEFAEWCCENGYFWIRSDKPGEFLWKKAFQEPVGNSSDLYKLFKQNP